MAWALGAVSSTRASRGPGAQLFTEPGARRRGGSDAFLAGARKTKVET
jgi:hypothetical protein